MHTVPGWNVSDYAFMLQFAAHLLFWCAVPAVTLSAIAATIDQYWPNVRALLRAAKEN